MEVSCSIVLQRLVWVSAIASVAYWSMSVVVKGDEDQNGYLDENYW